MYYTGVKTFILHVKKTSLQAAVEMMACEVSSVCGKVNN